MDRTKAEQLAFICLRAIVAFEKYLEPKEDMEGRYQALQERIVHGECGMPPWPEDIPIEDRREFAHFMWEAASIEHNPNRCRP